MYRLAMEWWEIKMRARDGASLQVLADLNGVSTGHLANMISEYEYKTGDKIIFRRQTVQKGKAGRNMAINYDDVKKRLDAGEKATTIATDYGVSVQTIYNARSRAAKKEKKDQKAEPEKDKPAAAMDEKIRITLRNNMAEVRDEIKEHEESLKALKIILDDWERLYKIAGGGSDGKVS